MIQRSTPKVERGLIRVPAQVPLGKMRAQTDEPECEARRKNGEQQALPADTQC